MASKRRGAGRVPLGALASVVVYLGLATVAPLVISDPGWLFVLPVLIYGSLGALHVYMMLRVNRLSFASTGFMAIGGYTMALVALHVTANVVVVALAAFIVPALVAVTLGLLVLRLRGVYFVLVSFVFSEIVVLIATNNDSFLGGSTGLSGVPILSLFGIEFGAGRSLLVISAALAMVGALAVAVVTIRWRRQLAAIEQNEPLALSLGLRVPLFTTMCLAIGAGAAGLGGTILVNTIGNAQTNSFDPFIALDHVTYAVVGGGSSMLGTVGGAFLLGWLAQRLASHSEYADLVYGAVLIGVVIFARGGIAGVAGSLVRWLRRHVARRPRPEGGPEHPQTSPASAQPALAELVGEDGDTHRRGTESADGASLPLDGRRLSVSALTKTFGGVAAVSAVDLSLGPGEVLGVIGPNGAGKTTLVNAIAGTIPASAGRVTLEGRGVSRLSPAGRCRRGMGRSYQQVAVFGPATVRENLERARVFAGARLNRDDIYDLSRVVGLDSRLEDVAQQLPYGLQKMLGLVMAFASDPRVLLMDEPAAGLESNERTQVDTLVAMARSRGCSVLLVEHDMDMVRRLCTRLVVLDGGKILAQGETEQVLTEPAVIAAYLGSVDETSDGAGKRHSQQKVHDV